jgi:hypothetical protein
LLEVVRAALGNWADRAEIPAFSGLSPVSVR